MRHLNIGIDFRVSVPIYQQIAGQIKAMVANGELASGEQLPTVRRLAADLQVNFNTVARAYRILDEAGIISTQHGRGTYIGGGGPAAEPLSKTWQLDNNTGQSPRPKPNRMDGRLGSHKLEERARLFFEEAIRMGSTEAEALSILEAAFERWQKSKHTPEK